jgi:hypothetical protein
MRWPIPLTFKEFPGVCKSKRRSGQPGQYGKLL